MQFIEGVIARCQNCLTDEEMKLFSYVLNEFFTFYLLNIYYSFTS